MAYSVNAQTEELHHLIQSSFSEAEYPGDSNLRNSQEGDEPFLLEKEFTGKDDWTSLSPDLIDQAPDGFASALSFFSKEAFRFYLPAYLLADIDGQLVYTEPGFYLTYGLTDATKDVRVNPGRYGPLTWFEYVGERFSVFTSEEALAIANYLKFKLNAADTAFERDAIDQALNNFWEDAAKTDAA